MARITQVRLGDDMLVLADREGVALRPGITVNDWNMRDARETYLIVIVKIPELLRRDATSTGMSPASRVGDIVFHRTGFHFDLGETT